MRALVITLGLFATAALADAPEVDFSRYQIIIDRAPFGALAPPVNTQVDPNAPVPPGFAESLRLSMILEDDETHEKRIGFVDKRNNHSYTMAVGDPPQDGIIVVSADFAKEEAVLQQGTEMALMKLSTGAATKMENGQPAGAPGGAPAPPPQAMSYQDRRRMRSLQNAPQAVPEPPKPKYTGEELTKHLSEYKLEVIRQGLPPLPIPLTQDEDAKLVKEGVLPPQ